MEYVFRSKRHGTLEVVEAGHSSISRGTPKNFVIWGNCWVVKTSLRRGMNDVHFAEDSGMASRRNNAKAAGSILYENIMEKGLN